ncbi:hypothetical protein NPX13_g3219 [Xylaria arbuscula]|uniref:Apple domain-containing protein n=1 Tax=Xylaria arbuscula TaxID=114810 RepID=A0A9W8NI63_9PEZI|nr:hypothetical protein NPX13_g3219 [Xylaria arbuscula]
MKSNTLLATTLVSLAGASPLQSRQLLDLALIDSAPDVSIYSPSIEEKPHIVEFDLPAATAAATASPLPVTATTEKRDLEGRTDACSPVSPVGTGPTAVPDTAAAFLAYSDFETAAVGAVTPDNYYRTFQNLQASSSAYGYSGFSYLDTYDTNECARRCDGVDSCLGFNIYFERDPTVVPGDDCLNPDSMTMIKCVYWGGYISAANAGNSGQYSRDFEVVIAGSNGYMKSQVPAISGYDGVALGNVAINAPLNCNNDDTYMGSKIFTTSFYDPGLCAAACESQNEYNTAHPPATGSPKICKFFVTFLAEKNGAPEGQMCVMYTQYWDTSYATNDGQWRGNDHYTNDYAFAYTNSVDAGLPVCKK